eukprot:TRINITY_DN9452_c0_g1_i1.p1 TRINITY_DN9452_c0_g1~~TRINITY_DN9452_c0_g1_i1.p1  ORF type:complete len:129 (+),score=12.96 TRINITY_DN9452_c0_g1_i1:11-397(+)
MKSEKKYLPPIDFTVMIQQMHKEYNKEFLQYWKITQNGTIQCRNVDIDNFNRFIRKWKDSIFRENNIILGTLTLETIEQKDTKTINNNKQKLVTLYGAAFQVYLKTCQFLRIQPDQGYTDIVKINLID